MAKNRLQRSSRVELLELLSRQMEQNARLQEENEQLKKELAERSIRIESSGTLAEAALKLSGIFEAADQAIQIYQEELQNRNLVEKPASDSQLPEANQSLQVDASFSLEQSKREESKASPVDQGQAPERSLQDASSPIPPKKPLKFALVQKAQQLIQNLKIQNKSKANDHEKERQPERLHAN